MIIIVGDDMKKNYIIIALIVLILGLIGFIYYKKTYYHFELKGNKEIVLVNDEEYIEPGFSLIDYDKNDLSSKIKVENNVIANTAGEYEIKYFLDDKLLDTRKVIIKQITFKLNDDDIVYVDLNSENNRYQELGFVATDENGNDFSNQVEIVGSINNVVGEYEIKYVLKIDNYTKELVRKVYVGKFINEIYFNEENITMYVGDNKELTFTYSPQDISDNNFTWESSDVNIVSVIDGKVVANAVGTATITVRTINNKEAKCTVTVSKKEDIIKVNYQKLAITGNEIKADITNLSGSNLNVTYYSDSACNSKLSGAPKEIGTYYVTASSLENDEYKSGNLSCTKALMLTKVPVTIKVGTFNMGQYKCGTGKYSCKPGYKDFAKYFTNSKADIFGVQEAEEYKTTEKAAKEAGFTNNYFRSPASTIGVISKYKLNSTSYKELTRCKEVRGIIKTVINVNGIDISFYVSHFSYQSECLDVHFAAAASFIKNDPNPSIIVADYNVVSKSYYEKYFKPLGYEIAAYDDTTTNMWGKNSYCDSIYVNSKGHIDIMSNETILAFNKVSDHNFVVATLNVY